MVETKWGDNAPTQVALIKDFLQTNEVSESAVSILQWRIGAGIDFKSLGIEGAVADEMILKIAGGICLATQFLRIHYPDSIVMLVSSNDGSSELSEDSMRQTLATSDRSKTFSNGIIYFSPVFLQQVAKAVGRGLFTEIALGALADIGMHETYHIWQDIEHPVELARDTKILRKSGKKAWLETWSEKEAIGFSLAVRTAMTELLRSDDIE
jgi:hypothetical protein